MITKKYVDFDSVLNTKYGCWNDKFHFGFPVICGQSTDNVKVQISIQFTHLHNMYKCYSIMLYEFQNVAYRRFLMNSKAV